jgi:hypothetical protein
MYSSNSSGLSVASPAYVTLTGVRVFLDNNKSSVDNPSA